MNNNSHDTSARKLRVFLCHASQDKSVVRDIYRRFVESNMEPWLDEKNLLPGEHWEHLIPDVIRKCDIILLCLSRTFLVKEGYAQYEVHVILEAAKYKPQGTIFLIPFRLDDCEVPSYLNGIHYASHFIPEDFDKLIAACEKKRERLNTIYGMNIEPIRKPPSQAALLEPPSAKPVELSSLVFVDAPFPDVWNVPRRHNAFFTGRDATLQQLADGFQIKKSQQTRLPQAITGLAGMGKTQTAAEYAYLFREKYRAVLWVHAQRKENLILDFQTIARLLGLSQQHIEDEDVLIQTMQKWFRSERDWLLIFDNADDFVLVDPFIPIGLGHVLLTTREGATIQLAQPTELTKLGVEDGALCLLRRAGLLRANQSLEDASSAHVDAAREIAQEVECLPLSLEQAGAYINDTRCGVIKYRQHYKHFRERLLNIRSGPILEYAMPVAVALMMSTSMIGRGSMAFALLQLCAFLAPEGIPDDFVVLAASDLGELLSPVAENPILLDQAIRLLVRHSLLEREEQTGMAFTTLSIHRILQLVLLDEMKKDKPTLQLWAERAVSALLRCRKTELWSVLQPHVQQCREHIAHWELSVPGAEEV